MRRLLCSALTIAVAGLALTGAPGAAPPGTRVIHVDPYSFPTAIARGFGSVWVAEHRGYHLNRIDPRTNRIAQRIRLRESACGSIAFGAGRVWVSNCAGETGVATTYEVNPRSGKVVGKVHGGDPVFAGGSLWTTDYPTPAIIRYDPRTHVVLKRIRLPISPGPNGTPTGSPAARALWTTNSVDAAARIDVATNRTTVIPLPGGHGRSTNGYFGVLDLVFAAGQVWVPNGAGLYSIDVATNTATLHPMKIGPFSQWGDVGIAAHSDAVYLRVSDRTVVRLDAHTSKVTKRYRATGGGGELLFAYDSLWITNADNDTIWREPL
jgi:streptogramin lyase